jgi:hypothetical protein
MGLIGIPGLIYDIANRHALFQQRRRLLGAGKLPNRLGANPVARANRRREVRSECAGGWSCNSAGTAGSRSTT